MVKAAAVMENWTDLRSINNRNRLANVPKDIYGMALIVNVSIFFEVTFGFIISRLLFRNGALRTRSPLSIFML